MSLLPMVLVVDDEVDMVENFVRLLSPHGYRCVVAQSGLRAIELLDREHPDLVITDLHLPGVGGLEIARHARRTSPPTPVLLVTANTRAGRRARDAGDVTAFLAKPFENTELLAMLQSLVPAPRRRDLRMAEGEGTPRSHGTR